MLKFMKNKLTLQCDLALRTCSVKKSNAAGFVDMAPELRYDGRTVLIVGASDELGRAYCAFFARRGANVVVHDTFKVCFTVLSYILQTLTKIRAQQIVL